MTLFPRRLAGQLTLVVIAAIAAAAGLLLILFSLETEQYERRAVRTFAIERLSDVLPVLDQSSVKDLPHEAKQRSRSGLRLSIDDDSWVKPKEMDDDERELAEDLKSELGLANRSVFLDLKARSLERNGSSKHLNKDDDDRPRFRRFGSVIVSLQMPQGVWLNAQLPRFQHRDVPGLPLRWLLPLMLGGGFVLLGVLFAVRGITRPMRALAQAAEKVGRGESVAPLPEKGPLEIREAIAAFNVMQGRLSAFVEDRTGMLAAISHDLRTPVTALRLRAEMLDEGEEKEAILRNVERMRQMVEATLNFTRDDVAREDSRAVDLSALIEGVADDFKDMGHDVQVMAPDHLVFQCRPAALGRAVSNLIRNAADYGKRARVNLRETDGSVVIEVDDDGDGIPDDKIRDVFKPFVRLDEARNIEGGTGLGLPIVSSIVKAHGGRIELENRLEGGLRARIVLPKPKMIR